MGGTLRGQRGIYESCLGVSSMPRNLDDIAVSKPPHCGLYSLSISLTDRKGCYLGFWPQIAYLGNVNSH